MGDNAQKTFDNYINAKYNGGEEYKQLKDRARWIKAKFPSEKSFNSHFEKHNHEFGNLTKEEYLAIGRELLSEPISVQIMGYDTEYRRVRYDIARNIFVLGDNKRGRFTTILKLWKERIIMSKIGKENLVIIDDMEYVYCPVCGTLTAVYDICDTCKWQNTGETNIDGGPNKMTLAEAKKAFAEGRPII